MSLINVKTLSNDHVSTSGLTVNHGSTQSAFISFANSIKAISGITKISNTEILIQKNGKYFIQLPLFMNCSSYSGSVFLDILINDTQVDSRTLTYSANLNINYTNILSINSNSTLKIRTRFNSVVSNHTNGCFRIFGSNYAIGNPLILINRL